MKTRVHPLATRPSRSFPRVVDVCPRATSGALAILVFLASITLGGATSSSAERRTPVAQPASASTPSTFESALEALRSGDLVEATSLLSEHLAQNPDDARAHLMLSRTLERQGQPTSALTHARRAEELGNLAAPLQGARLLARLGSLAAAYEATVRAREAEPRSVDAYLLGTLLLRDLGRGAEAYEVATQALERGLENATLYEQHALLALEIGSPQAALTSARAGLAIAPENPQLHFAVAMAMVDSGDLSESSISQAIERLERALELGISGADRVELELADLLLAAERPAEALEYLVRASQRQPTADIFYKLALTQRQLGNEQAAAAAIERFTELREETATQTSDERTLGVRLNEIQQLAESNQLSEALMRIEALISEHRDSADARALEAKVLFSLQRSDRAVESIRRAVTLAPGDASFRYLEGLFLRLTGDPEGSATALRSALAIRPDLGEAHALLGGIELESEDVGAAVEHFQRAVELGISSPDLHRAYAKALADLGRDAESARQLEAAKRAEGGA